MRFAGGDKLLEVASRVAAAGERASAAVARAGFPGAGTHTAAPSGSTPHGGGSSSGGGRPGPFGGFLVSDFVSTERDPALRMLRQVLAAFNRAKPDAINPSRAKKQEIAKWLTEESRQVGDLLARLGGDFWLGLLITGQGRVDFKPEAWGEISNLSAEVLRGLIGPGGELPEPQTLLEGWERKFPDFLQIVERHKVAGTAGGGGMAGSGPSPGRGTAKTTSTPTDDPLVWEVRKAIAEAILPGQARQVSPELAQRLLDQFPGLPDDERVESAVGMSIELAHARAQWIANHLRPMGHSIVPEDDPGYMQIVTLAVKLVVTLQDDNQCIAKINEAIKAHDLDDAIGIINGA